MVSQPGYIERLKEYARRRARDKGYEYGEILLSFSSESDRGAIILAATSLEDSLELKIRQKLPGLQGDVTAGKKLFEHNGSLATFSSKIEMAYAMGIIDKDYRKKIDLIREIRNACAHSRLTLSLDVSELLDAVKAVIKGTWDYLKDRTTLTVRLAFVVECSFISHYVMTGEKIEGLEAQLAHYTKLKQAAQS